MAFGGALLVGIGCSSQPDREAAPAVGEVSSAVSPPTSLGCPSYNTFVPTLHAEPCSPAGSCVDVYGTNYYCAYDESTLGQEYGGSVQVPYLPPKATIIGFVSGHDFTNDPNLNFNCSYDNPTSPNACNKPNVASGDFSFNHNDRDFNIQIVPMNAARTAIDSSLLRYANCSGQTSIDVESEFMDFFPTLDSRNFNGQTIAPGNPAFYVTRDGLILGSPGAGDEIVTMGILADDCGEIDEVGARREIHPPVATAWAHKNLISSPTQSDIVVWMRASSHYRKNNEALFNQWPAMQTSGAQGEQWEATFSATFDVPHSANSLGTMYVGPIVSDWVVAPVDYATTPNPYAPATQKGAVFPMSTSGVLDVSTPNALWAWWDLSIPGQPRSVPYSASDMKWMYDANDYFAMTVAPDETNHKVTVTMSPRPGKEAYGDLPNLIGAHVRACYLECVNGVKQNNCPGTCPCSTTNTCSGYTCGTVTNCGQTVSCGTCAPGYRCDGSPAGNCIFDCSQCVDPMYCNAAGTGCVCDPCTTQIRSACAKQGLVCACGQCM